MSKTTRPSRFPLILALAGLAAAGACGGSPLAGVPVSPPPPLVDVPHASPIASASPSVVPPAPDPVIADAIARPPGGTLSSYPVFTDAGEMPSLHVATSASKRATDGEAFPLEHTDVRAVLSEFAADVEVTQTFRNPKDAAIEAVYVFPLPDHAAVHDMQMKIGDRVIASVVEERGAARRAYDQAKAQGFTAGLLEQERPNVFTQSVANLEPGKTIQVVIRYTEELSYDAGLYEFVFPLVVGPRFVPGNPLNGPQSGTGTKPDTTLVPDASRISPPYAAKEGRSGTDVSLEVLTRSSLAVGAFESPSHELVSHRDGDGTLDLKLKEQATIPNRDFVLRYRAAGDEPRSSMIVDRSTGYFALTIDPPNLDVEDLVGKRELVFVVDVSGSMAGVPLDRCKQAMREALAHVRPVDTFNVITFSGSTGKLFEKPLKATQTNVAAASAFVDQMKAGGGTMMLDAIGTALSPDVEAGRNRYVFFMTDGYVGGDDQMLAATRRFVGGIEAKGNRAKVFGFGVGSSPNRNLLDGLSREGKGLAVYASDREDPARAVNQFYRYIDRSVLRDVAIDWGSFAASETFPATMPDLFASHPLVIRGRFAARDGTKPTVVVKATGAKGAVTIPVAIVDLPALAGGPKSFVKDDAARAPAGLLGTLWARSKVGWIEDDITNGGAQARAEITKLGLDYNLVTRFTSFVAIDWSQKTGAGNPTTIAQPVEVPAGVDGVSAGALGQIPSPSPPMPGGQGMPDRAVDADGTSDRTMGSAPMEPQRGPRGCNCSIPESESSGGWAALLLLAAIVKRRIRPSTSASRGAEPRSQGGRQRS